MKPKILINGRNQNLVTDFMRQTELSFDTISTSNYWNDIAAHFRFFQPNVYIAFLDTGLEQMIRDLAKLKESDFFNGSSIVLIGDADACNMVERKSRDIADLVIRRPVTPDNLAMRIKRHLEDTSHAKASHAAFQAKTDQMDALIKAAEAAISESTASMTAPAAGGKASAAGASAAAVGKKHILVVDDDRTVLKMLKTALEERYDVTTMASGAMVEKMLDVKKVDMIILDYEMPIETGAEVFQRLKRNPRAANIPVCFLTGVSDREKIMEVMSLKPSGYVLKPIDMDTLNNTIRSIIG